MTIAPDQISFVIQGPLRPELGDNVRSIRALFPGAEIVLSTWPVEGDLVEVDKLVVSQDPGRTGWRDNENTSRQIVSTRNGLLTASRPYAVKMRSDCVLTGDGFLHVDVEGPRDDRYAVFRRRIVCPTLFTRNPLRWALLFHPSDMFHFGLRSDLLQLWSVPPVHRFLVDGKLQVNASEHLVPEQYLFRTFLETRGIELPAAVREDPDPAHVNLSNAYLTQNFWVESEANLGISYPAREAQSWHRPKSIFTPEEWRAVAARHAPERG